MKGNNTKQKRFSKNLNYKNEHTMITINSRQKEQYKEDGFTIVPDFLNSDDLKLVRSICDVRIKEIEEEMESKGIVQDRINVLGKKYFIINTRKKYPEINDIIFNEKTAEVCKATIGDTAYLHNEQFVVKMMDTNTNFAWHQDSGYSVYQGGAALHKPYLTCWIALDDMSKANGTISVLPFSRSPSRNLIEHKWDQDSNAMVGYYGNDPGDLVEVNAGTLVAFSSFLLHKSGANLTNRPRRSYFIAFTPDLFTYADDPNKLYNSGEPFLQRGKLIFI
jgi:ectoine hydroxylase-related dioxygenase (phytanoyl-CoA dioxygenase family)